MRVTIAKVHENLFAGEAEALIAPTTEGILTILGNHEPVVATLKEGTLIVKADGTDTTYEIAGGVLEVSGNQATVLL